MFNFIVYQGIDQIYFTDTNHDNQWTRNHGFFALLGGFLPVKDRSGNIHGAPLFRNPKRRDPHISPPYWVSEDEIRDKDKNGFFAKVIATGQTFWFIAQFLTRIAQGLPVTQIEAIVVSYAILSLATFFFILDKPFGVSYPIKVLVPEWRSEEDKTFHKQFLWDVDKYNYLVANPVSWVCFIFSMSSGAALFLALLGDPPQRERWILCSAVVTAAPPMATLCYAFVNWIAGTDPWGEQTRGETYQEPRSTYLGDFILLILTSIIQILLILAYFAARIWLIIMACSSLRSLPLAAFETVTWSTFIPHL